MKSIYPNGARRATSWPAPLLCSSSHLFSPWRLGDETNKPQGFCRLVPCCTIFSDTSSISLHIYTYIYIYTYCIVLIYIYTDSYIYDYICVYIHILCIRTYIYIYTCICMVCFRFLLCHFFRAILFIYTPSLQCIINFVDCRQIYLQIRIPIPHFHCWYLLLLCQRWRLQ
jgi:hypothetical protein